MSDYFASLVSDPAVTTIGLAAGGAVIALWLAAAWWAHADAVRRTEHGLAGYLAAGWILLSTPLLMPLALAIYAFARPGVTASEQRSRRLATELMATTAGPVCPSCREPVDSMWQRCPACAAWLAVPCSACGEWSPVGLEICPHCAAEGWAAPSTPDLRPAAVTSLGRGRWPRRAARSGRTRATRPSPAGHETTAAGGVPAAVGATRGQRDRFISSARPRSYATSRESLSDPS
jgi:hypothetical protein